jgi:outer membrane protein assembly factor BamB
MTMSALDAKTGKQLWAWYSDIPQVGDLICCGWTIAVWPSATGVYSGLLDGGFVALDQKMGQCSGARSWGLPRWL